tara:strand:+ start:3081 stop:4373 length:1293 start_codon:yes stop_codon:yes gene_type:complete
MYGALPTSDPSLGGRIESVSVSLDRIAVGIPESQDGGFVNVFRRDPTGWVLEATLRAPETWIGDAFGTDVSLDGTTLAVVSPGVFGTSQALIHVFDLVAGTWQMTTRLGRPTCFNGNWTGLGWVEIRGNHIVSKTHHGSPFSHWRRVGSEWEYQGDQGQSTNILSTNGSMDGARLAVADTHPSAGTGRILLYELAGGTWTNTQTVTLSDAQSGDLLGLRLDLTGDRLLASLDRDGGYVVRFGRNDAGDYVELDRIGNPSTALNSKFAEDQVLYKNGETLISDRNGNGAIHTYREIVGPANLCPVTANSTGHPSVLWATGSVEVNRAGLVLNVAGLPINEFGYFISGPNTGQAPVLAGTLCLGAPIGRHDDLVLFSGRSGTVSRLIDLTSMPIPTPPFATMLVPGDTWHLQYWHRDGSSANFSDAITITAE